MIILFLVTASAIEQASATAEACSLALSVTRNKTIMYSDMLNSNYINK